MCGIFGYIDKNQDICDLAPLHKATGLLSHRGPDNSGFVKQKNIYVFKKKYIIFGW